MNHFEYRDNRLFCENVDIEHIAEEVGTPFYVYSSATLERHLKVFREPFAQVDHLICYAMKANSSLAVMKLLFSQGAGADIVSAGELFKTLKAGVDPRKVVFSGVGKTAEEMEYALKTGIFCFNVESLPELEALNAVALRLGKTAPVSIRVNPDVDPKTHPYISTGLKESKFGVAWKDAVTAYQRAHELEAIEVAGLDCHIGSQITQVEPFIDALRKLKELVAKLRGMGIPLHHLDLGGGLGINYNQEAPPHPAEYGRHIVEETRGLDLKLVFEPGRVIVGNAGVLVTRVIYDKLGETKRFLVVDAAMNDLIRPAFYGSHHRMTPVHLHDGRTLHKVDVVGPVCETGDFLARDRELPELRAGELLAVHSAGAYGAVMGSTYNARPLTPEVLVKGGEWWVTRRRQTFDDLIALEFIPRETGG
ncbi:MAG: Diaminopimelate decarboxylase [Myxococcota bacterium]|nr:Diaminopimelate decarboxylase [Myxococcota bacterium]